MSDSQKHALYFSLKRALTHCGFSKDALPTDLKQWETFLDRINFIFYDFDQERYLLERSMELSSAEFLEINQQFEVAESIAHIGHWSFRSSDQKICWSKQMYEIFGLDDNIPPANFDDCIQFVHEEDRAHLTSVVEDAALNGKNYEIELRIINQKDRTLRWVYARGITSSIDNVESKSALKFNLNGILMDITERKKSEESLEALNKRLIDISRKAGMSEVAASVLHNIGNILNSANVSIVMMNEILNDSLGKKLGKINAILSEGLHTNPNTVFDTEKGRLIPQYYDALSKSLIDNEMKLKKEMQELEKHVEHIKDIIFMQNEISGVVAANETIGAKDICKQAIQMSYNLKDSNHFALNQYFAFEDDIVIDKTKLLQILVNLLRNAKEAVKGNQSQHNNVINIHTNKIDDNTFEIIVSDNGVGISEENIGKIFSMGFTTKQTGHGFGLHMSAIAATEMGGQLQVSSQGINRGATFTLTLPINAEIQNDGD